MCRSAQKAEKSLLCHASTAALPSRHKKTTPSFTNDGSDPWRPSRGCTACCTREAWPRARVSMPAGPRYLTSLLCSRWPAWESWDGVCEIGGGVEGSWERGGAWMVNVMMMDGYGTCAYLLPHCYAQKPTNTLPQRVRIDTEYCARSKGTSS